MFSPIQRSLNTFIILCTLLLNACTFGNFPAEAPSATDQTSSSQRQAAEPTRAESDTIPTVVTSLPPAQSTATPTKTVEPTTQSDIYSVTDEFDAVTYFLPREWDEYLVGPWMEDNDVIGSFITASSDVDAYLNWGTPGVSIYVSRRLDKGYLQMMDEFRNIFAGTCDEYLSTWDYENSIHRGRRQRFWRCGGEDGPTLDLVALVNKDDWQAYTAIVVIVWFYPVEYQLIEDYLLSFVVTPENLP